MSSPTPPPQSPWARPEGATSTAAPPRPAPSIELGRGSESSGGLTAGPVRVFAAGAVTSTAVGQPLARQGAALPSPPLSPSRNLMIDPVRESARQRRRTMRWFAGSAGGIVAAGIVILLALVLTGHSPFPPRVTNAPDTRPILAKLCPPPSAGPAPDGATPATPAGPRTVDRASGISYRSYGAPWMEWNMAWETGGQLGVVFRTGQFFVTEPYPDSNSGYLATILSGSVPAATNDALTLDLECAGHQVAADVRQAYYPQPNTMDSIVDKATTIGGRPAWLSEFELHFHMIGLTATSERVAIALLDVGKPNASILYISIPGTHKQFDYVIDQLLASVRPT